MLRRVNRIAGVSAIAQAKRFATGPATDKAKFTDPDMTHFRDTPTPHPLAIHKNKKPSGEWDNPMQNQVWTPEEVNGVKKTHVPTSDIVDKIAYCGVRLLRVGFDIVSGYYIGRLNRDKILRRILFLETAAGVPGMVAGSLRHLRSLRLMKRDYGWIHTLLEEAENERMHMLVFMRKHKPGLVFRSAVVITQGVFWNVFFWSYLLSPRLCHRFVGYLEEEAVRTYTHILEVMDSSNPADADVVAFSKSPADDIAIRYWRLNKDATMKDVVRAVRRDEANHRDVNHTFASLQRDDRSPFIKVAQEGPTEKK